MRELLKEDGHCVSVIDLAHIPAGHDGPAEDGIDLTEESGVAAAVARLAEQMGGVDGLINAAGGFLWETVADGALDSWDRIYWMNVRIPLPPPRAPRPRIFQAAARSSTSAAAAANVTAGMAPYAAYKAGVMALTEGLAYELRGRRIRVNAVLPTILDTPANRTDMPDANTSIWVQPRAAARVIAFLLSEASACVTGVGIKLSVGG